MHNMAAVCVEDYFGGYKSSLLDELIPHIYTDARHALTGAVFHLSKMRSHIAADARVTSGALYL